MPSNRYYFDEGTLSVENANGTSITVGEARGVSITPVADHNRFTGPDSIKIQDKKRSNFRVNVELEVAEWDEQFGQYYLGTGNTTATTVNDTNAVQDFNVTAEQPMTSGDFKLKAIAIDTDFEEMPLIDGAEGEYSSRQLTGTAVDVEFTNVSA